MVNSLSFTERKRVRKNFGTLKEVTKFPNLIEIQKGGKKKMKRVGSVEIPQEAFLAVLRTDDK